MEKTIKSNGNVGTSKPTGNGYVPTGQVDLIAGGLKSHVNEDSMGSKGKEREKVKKITVCNKCGRQVTGDIRVHLKKEHPFTNVPKKMSEVAESIQDTVEKAAGDVIAANDMLQEIVEQNEDLQAQLEEVQAGHVITAMEQMAIVKTLEVAQSKTDSTGKIINKDLVVSANDLCGDLHIAPLSYTERTSVLWNSIWVNVAALAKEKFDEAKKDIDSLVEETCDTIAFALLPLTIIQAELNNRLEESVGYYKEDIAEVWYHAGGSVLNAVLGHGDICESTRLFRPTQRHPVTRVVIAVAKGIGNTIKRSAQFLRHLFMEQIMCRIFALNNAPRVYGLRTRFTDIIIRSAKLCAEVCTDIIVVCSRTIWNSFFLEEGELMFRITGHKLVEEDDRTLQARGYTGYQFNHDLVGHFYVRLEFNIFGQRNWTEETNVACQYQLTSITQKVFGVRVYRECEINLNALQDCNAMTVMYGKRTEPEMQRTLVSRIQAQMMIDPGLFRSLRDGRESISNAMDVVRMFNKGSTIAVPILRCNDAVALK